jgi:hypothetical protein
LDSPNNNDYGNAHNANANPPPSQNPLISKQAIIVLREELEYFSIPPRDAHMQGADLKMDTKMEENGGGMGGMGRIKQRCGDYLMGKRSIFTALQRNVNKENNVAEQHLIDMLCMRWVSSFRAGFFVPSSCSSFCFSSFVCFYFLLRVSQDPVLILSLYSLPF